jgi:hypothetical protein
MMSAADEEVPAQGSGHDFGALHLPALTCDRRASRHTQSTSWHCRVTLGTPVSESITMDQSSGAEA